MKRFFSRIRQYIAAVAVTLAAFFSFRLSAEKAKAEAERSKRQKAYTDGLQESNDRMQDAIEASRKARQEADAALNKGRRNHFEDGKV